MNGCILTGAPIAVDFWTIRGKKNCFIHFLSHVHGDHLIGLTSTWTQPIYCSSFTAKILHIHYGISKSLLHHLPTNQPIIISLPHSERTFCVTAFDANHCPGALMFYFQGDFGNIFYTGDFRYSSDIMLGHIIDLQGKIDSLYIDNTFCSPLCKFPKRQECLSQIINIVKEHPDHDVIIGLRKFGKEAMLVELGCAVNETIYVSSERLKIIQLLYSTNIFCTVSDAKEEKCRIRTVPFHQVSSSFINNLNETTPTIAILPSAIFTGLPSKPFSRNPNVHVIPFSDHSSFSELIEFVSQLKPSHIIPIVKNKRGPFGIDVSDRQDMTCFKPFMIPRTSSLVDKPDVDLCKDGEVNDSILETTSEFLTNAYNKAESNCLLPQLSESSKLCGLNYKSDDDRTDKYNQSIDVSNTDVFRRLKRKKSIPFCSKRKMAKGVCYIDEQSTQQSSCINKTDYVISNESKTAKNICSVLKQSSLTTGPDAGVTVNRKKEYQTVVPKKKNELLNSNSLRSDKNSITDSLVSRDCYKNSNHSSLFSQKEKEKCSEGTQSSDSDTSLEGRNVCNSSQFRNDLELKHEEKLQLDRSLDRDKYMEDLTLKSDSNVPVSSTTSGCGRSKTIPFKRDKFDILSFLGKRKRPCNLNQGNTSNESMILSLKSVINKWEKNQ